MSSDTKSAQRRGADAIRRVAEELFARHGFDGVSVSAIAQTAGCSKANVFHHFPSKEALYYAVLQSACAASRQALEAAADGSTAFAERLQRFGADHLRIALDNDRITRLMLREALAHTPERGQALAQEVYGEHFERLVSLIRQGQRSGEVRAELDPALVAVVLIGADLFLFQSRPVLRHLPGVDFADDPERFSRMLADLLLRGCLADPAQRSRDGGQDE